eukprot:COSAG02_NODE_378_length_23535_cov_35.310164_14_plen_865_part_00
MEIAPRRSTLQLARECVVVPTIPPLPQMMAQQMKHMPSLPTLANVLCHIATIAVVMHGRTDLGTAPGVVGGSHRHLESTANHLGHRHDPLAMDPLAQTVARLEKAVDTHGARLTAVEEESTELKAILKKRTEGHEGTGRGVEHTPTAGAQLFQNTTGDDIQAQLRSLQRRDDELQTSIHALAQERQRRGLQGAEPEPEPEIGENVKIIKPAVVRCGGPGTKTSNGHFDYARCASDPAFATCHAEACAGHRRAQAGDGSGAGTCSDLESRSAEVTRVCCDEPEEDCTGGYPHSCNAGCAATFLPFWEECRTALGKDSQRFEPVVALCTASAGSSGTASRPSLAEQLNLQCTDGTAAAECVPQCSAAYHGYLMLLNIDGEDSKLSCELHHTLYSWMGSAVRPPLPRLLHLSTPLLAGSWRDDAQTDGGYIGFDVASFISAIVSAAAGIYSVSLTTAEQSIDIDLVFQPNQIVHVNAASSSFALGSGALTVSRDSELTLSQLTVSASIVVSAGAILTLEDVLFVGALACVSLEGGSSVVRLGTTTSAIPECPEPCGEIENCVRSYCETADIVVCDICEQGFYSFRHDEDSGHCKGNTITLRQAGLIADAVGVFDFRFAGSVPSDLAGGEVIVPASASLSLMGTGAEVIGASFTTVDGSISITSMDISVASLASAMAQLSGVGNTLRLDSVNVPDSPTRAALTTVVMSVAANGSKAVDPPNGFGGPFFVVASGPCTVSEGGRCVGRPEGYGPNEDCAITVGGHGGVLDPCPVFDMYNIDTVVVPGGTYMCFTDGDWVNDCPGTEHRQSDCPVGVALGPGDVIAFTSDEDHQGSTNWPSGGGNGCEAKGTCGLPFSMHELGGGWELCFA